MAHGNWHQQLAEILEQLEELCRYKMRPKERTDLRMSRRAIRRVLKLDDRLSMPEETLERTCAD